MITGSAQIVVPVLEGLGFTEDSAVAELNAARVKSPHLAASDTTMVRITYQVTYRAGKFSIARL
jgi:hypothetical protein